jgi:oxalate decarboxylase/phosphoglucose isomerase-like protein (cupin superfamily)
MKLSPAILVRLLLLLLVVTLLLPTLVISHVTELGVYNLASVLQNHTWTCVLFYDKLDERHRIEWHTMMESLDSTYFHDDPRVGFAMLDIRAHPTYRSLYKYPDDPHPFIYEFYTEFPDIQGDDVLRVSSRTLLNLQGDLYWPSRFTLFASDYNVYGELDMDFNSEIEAKVAILAHWIGSTVHKEPNDMEILMPSQLQKERDMAEQMAGRDNSFDFENHFAAKQENNNTTEDDPTDQSRYLLESGAIISLTEGGDSYYKYDTITVDARHDSQEWLELLSHVIQKYLTWVEGYETVWDADRKAREDQQTNFGNFIQELDNHIKSILDTIFTDPEYQPKSTSKLENQENPIELTEEDRERRNQVPHALKGYLDEMVFGYSRSPTSLREYLHHVSDTLGMTAEERREGRSQAHSFALFQRLRDYMEVVEAIAKEKNRYLHVLADLTTQWYNLLVAFQENLQHYYIHEYLPHHPLEHPFNITRYTMDVIDMEDPSNAKLLSDYDAFHVRYTLQAEPVILSNVNMTDEYYTLEYLIQQCGSMDVTDHVRISNPVGQKSTSEWGGLESFTLDDDLLNEERIELVEDSDGQEAVVVDRSITLQQFVALSERLGNLYLHDHSLPNDCDNILYEGTLYGGHSKYRIPAVLAAYDLFHRVTLYNYARSWPSLFIGKKGSNSKLHVDSGASGFFMYLVSGRKRWVVYHPSEQPFLYDRIDNHAFIPDVLGMDKSMQANEFLSKRFPLLHRAEKAYEIIQEPGQLIYIPPSCPHAVENLDDIVGIALNMAPRDGLANHLHDQIHGERRFGYTELALKYWLFADNARQAMVTRNPLYMDFGEYKAQY